MPTSSTGSRTAAPTHTAASASCRRMCNNRRPRVPRGRLPRAAAPVSCRATPTQRPRRRWGCSRTAAPRPTARRRPRRCRRRRPWEGVDGYDDRTGRGSGGRPNAPLHRALSCGEELAPTSADLSTLPLLVDLLHLPSDGRRIRRRGGWWSHARTGRHRQTGWRKRKKKENKKKNSGSHVWRGKWRAFGSEGWE
jgi:hypothetical protein